MDFSVVIPAHNVEDYIEKTLASIKAQTLQPLEIIVVDDGSMDSTVELVRKSGLPIRLIQSANGNAAASRNDGVSQAKGSWIAFLDGDDFWHENYLETMAALIRNTSSIAVLSNFMRLDSELGETKATRPLMEKSKSGLGEPELIPALKRSGHGFPTSGMVVARSRFFEVGGFDVSQARRHDVELFMRVVAGHQWSYNAVPLWTYRAGRPGNISNMWPECTYFALRAYLLNEAHYGKRFEGLIASQARKVLGSCHEIKDPKLRERAWNDALPRNSMLRRLLYSFSKHIPGVTWLIKLPKRLAATSGKPKISHG